MKPIKKKGAVVALVADVDEWDRFKTWADGQGMAHSMVFRRVVQRFNALALDEKLAFIQLVQAHKNGN